MALPRFTSYDQTQQLTERSIHGDEDGILGRPTRSRGPSGTLLTHASKAQPPLQGASVLHAKVMDHGHGHLDA